MDVDLVCTTWFPDLSREMGMKIGAASCIDDVTAGDLVGFSQNARYPLRRLRKVCHELAELIVPSITGALDEAPACFDELTWKAEDLIEDVEPRRRMLERM